MSWFDDLCVLAPRAKQRAYLAWSSSRAQADFQEHRGFVVMLSVCMSFNERSKGILTNAPNPRKWCSTVKTAVFGMSSSLPPLLDREGRLVWPADEKKHCFRRTLTPNNVKIVFRNRTLVTIVQYPVLLLSVPALFAECL